MSTYAKAGLIIVLVLTLASASRDASGQSRSAASSATIRGTVLDRTGGDPIADVLVELQDLKLSVKTDAAGRFELTNVTPGRRTLFVSVVGFVLVKRPVEVAPGDTADVTIALTEGTGTYSEDVTVTGGRLADEQKSAPAQETLGSAEIQNLRNLLTNDPLRAIQVLPGVTNGDDFRAEFAVRGSGFNRMTFTFDGIPSSFLLHTVQQVDDGGSIAMVNGDILDGITLRHGSYPQHHGNRLGAELEFHMREGSRARTQARAGVSGTDASVVVEGPLGKACGAGTPPCRARGSWLVSARKSYLELLLKQISDDNDFGFGFSDAQAKVAYDLSPRQRLELTVIAGQSRLDQQVTATNVNEIQDGRNAAQLVNGAWQFTLSPSFVLTERVAIGALQFRNRNVAGTQLGDGDSRDITWRTDVLAQASRGVAIEAGTQVQWQSRRAVEQQSGLQGALRDLRRYDGSAVLSSGYAHARWALGSRATLSAGGRIDRWSLTDETTASPWAQASVRIVGSLALRAGGGTYRQFPGVDEVVGLQAGVDLRPERARHVDAGVEQSLSGGTSKWQVTFYDRAERDVLRLPGSELRIVDGRLVLPAPAAWANTLDGYARGVELLVQRRATSGVSGWVSYAYGVNRYHDRTTSESFDGDFDQRHTLNAYAIYRVTSNLSLAAKLRIGSNTPAIGYWEQRGDAYFVGAERNTVRVPAYSRLDIRANRVFNARGKRLTLFAELLNAFAHDNQRFNPGSIDTRTRQVFGLFESTIPLIPSAGILLEF